MDTKSKILFLVFGFLVVLSVSASYYRFMVLSDYLVQAEVDCDPASESCFVWECDPEEEECVGDPEEDTWYYKIAYRNAKNIPACDAEDEACEQFTCPLEGEAECSEVLCSTESLAEYYVDLPCTLPEDFAEEMLTEEDEEVSSDDTDVDEESDETNETSAEEELEELANESADIEEILTETVDAE